jgi:IS605 OrfB family transposase
MQLTHKIALCPTPEQVDYFKRACGTARRVWNWALNEWNKQYASGGKPNAMALKKQFNAIKFRGRRLSRKLEAAKEMAGYGRHACLPKGTRLPVLNNRQKSAATLARLHARLANLRADFTHKLTTRLCRENQALGIEDLNVKGMLVNEKLARAISDVGFGVFRSQLEYLKRLATETALPVASPTSNGGAATERVSVAVGKVTPVRYELAVGHSGQEENCAHFCALS